jgi:hypothetical protein
VVQKTSAREFQIQGEVRNSWLCRWIGSAEFFDCVAGPVLATCVLAISNFVENFVFVCFTSEKLKIKGCTIHWVPSVGPRLLWKGRTYPGRVIVDHGRIVHILEFWDRENFVFVCVDYVFSQKHSENLRLRFVVRRFCHAIRPSPRCEKCVLQDLWKYGETRQLSASAEHNSDPTDKMK